MIATTLAQAQQQLETISSSARLDAELLLAHVLKTSRSHLYTWPEQQIAPPFLSEFQTLLQQRIQGWPIAYLLGHQAFWTLDLLVTPATLIPRPETELLVETVLQLGKQDQVQTVLDLGTGSGAIALAIAKEQPHWHIHAVDVSNDALAVARENAQRHQIHNITFHQSHWLDSLPTDLRADILVSNPPYIAEHDPHLQQGDVRFEPCSALIAGTDGLDAIRHIVGSAHKFMNPHAWLLLEHGYDQAQAIIELFTLHNITSAQQRPDLHGHIRISYGQVTSSTRK